MNLHSNTIIPIGDPRALRCAHADLVLLKEAEIALCQVQGGQRLSSAEFDQLLAD